MNKMTVHDVDFSGKRVLMRVDFNVPLDEGKIIDETRIRAAIPTIQLILDQNPRSLVLMSHLGRPKDKINPRFSLAPVAPALSAYLSKEVVFVDDCIGEKVEVAVKDLPDNGILLLENTRFHAGERKNDAEMASQLAKLGDIFVNDAFGSAHRAHASTVGVTEHLEAVGGLLMEKEIDYLATALETPRRPFVAILGGAKVSDKIAVIKVLLSKVDLLLIGGGMANTFFKAQGIQTGDSLVEEDAVSMAKSLLEHAGKSLVLPIDVVVGDRFANDSDQQIIHIKDGVADGWAIYDIGPEAVDTFSRFLEDANTIVWNGPMGVFEMPNFARGTFAIAQLLADLTAGGATSIIGGGDSAAAVQSSGLANKITHISTGGGASLEMLEGKTLPGVVALKDKI